MPKERGTTAEKNRPRKGGASVGQSHDSPLQNYIGHHRKTAEQVYRQIVQKPVSSAFTSTVIGVALVFPMLLVIVLSNIQNVDYDWKSSAQISLFLKKGVPELDAGILADSIAQRTTIAKVDFISNKAALEDLRARYDFDEVLDSLDENPLPHVILVTPSDALADVNHLKQLSDHLAELPEVDQAHLDAVWVDRLHNLVAFIERTLWVISVLLSIAVLLIVGNTIRLAIENRRDEIIVVKLVGGTDAFVCRPFLYLGSILGALGSIFALLMVQCIAWMLSGPIVELVDSYQGDFELSILFFESALLLLLVGTSLGWLGSWLAVRRHLKDVEPT